MLQRGGIACLHGLLHLGEKPRHEAQKVAQQFGDKLPIATRNFVQVVKVQHHPTSFLEQFWHNRRLRWLEV
jgi:hypothetical protein